MISNPGLLSVVMIRVMKSPTFFALQDSEQREMRIKLRKAQSEMKGVKLQYTDEGRVTFDDVAGIGESKVRHQSSIIVTLIQIQIALNSMPEFQYWLVKITWKWLLLLIEWATALSQNWKSHQFWYGESPYSTLIEHYLLHLVICVSSDWARLTRSRKEHLSSWSILQTHVGLRKSRSLSCSCIFSKEL